MRRRAEDEEEGLILPSWRAMGANADVGPTTVANRSATMESFIVNDVEDVVCLSLS